MFYADLLRNIETIKIPKKNNYYIESYALVVISLFRRNRSRDPLLCKQWICIFLLLFVIY